MTVSTKLDQQTLDQLLDNWDQLDAAIKRVEVAQATKLSEAVDVLDQKRVEMVKTIKAIGMIKQS